MNIKSIVDKVKGTVQKRGGTESVKEDAGELKDIAWVKAASRTRRRRRRRHQGAGSPAQGVTAPQMPGLRRLSVAIAAQRDRVDDPVVHRVPVDVVDLQRQV